MQKFLLFSEQQFRNLKNTHKALTLKEAFRVYDLNGLIIQSVSQLRLSFTGRITFNLKKYYLNSSRSELFQETWLQCTTSAVGINGF